MLSRFIALIILFLTITASFQVNAEVVKIAVFSPQNFHVSMKQWQATANYLTAKIPAHVFQVLPYTSYSDLETDMKKNKLDFLIAAKHQLPRFATEFPIIPVMNSRSSNHTNDWALVRKRQLPYQLTFSVSEALLNLPEKHKALKQSGIAGWKISADAHVAISQGQKLKKVFHTSYELVSDVVNQYRSYILAALVSGLLIFLYQLWDRYHLAQQLKKHRQQRNDPRLSDTVS
jgi:hypothetical protein